MSRILVFRTGNRYLRLGTPDDRPRSVRPVTLTEKNKVLRMQKARKLLIGTENGTHISTLFTDEQLFTVKANKLVKTIESLLKTIRQLTLVFSHGLYLALELDSGRTKRTALLRIVQRHLSNDARTIFPLFIAASEWPASSPGLNPMDYAVWRYLSQKVSTKNYANINALKTALVKAWDEIDNDYLRTVVNTPKDSGP
uniref:Uncharacterized protein n=1 Tax=Caenorhabditis japonica TaxID=281687 RepID=A0A8R1I5Y4_CAEJA